MHLGARVDMLLERLAHLTAAISSCETMSGTPYDPLALQKRRPQSKETLYGASHEAQEDASETDSEGEVDRSRDRSDSCEILEMLRSLVLKARRGEGSTPRQMSYASKPAELQPNHVGNHERMQPSQDSLPAVHALLAHVVETQESATPPRAVAAPQGQLEHERLRLREWEYSGAHAAPLVLQGQLEQVGERLRQRELEVQQLREAVERLAHQNDSLAVRNQELGAHVNEVDDARAAAVAEAGRRAAECAEAHHERAMAEYAHKAFLVHAGIDRLEHRAAAPQPGNALLQAQVLHQAAAPFVLAPIHHAVVIPRGSALLQMPPVFQHTVQATPSPQAPSAMFGFMAPREIRSASPPRTWTSGVYVSPDPCGHAWQAASSSSGGSISARLGAELGGSGARGFSWTPPCFAGQTKPGFGSSCPTEQQAHLWQAQATSTLSSTPSWLPSSASLHTSSGSFHASLSFGVGSPMASMPHSSCGLASPSQCFGTAHATTPVETVLRGTECAPPRTACAVPPAELVAVRWPLSPPRSRSPSPGAVTCRRPRVLPPSAFLASAEVPVMNQGHWVPPCISSHGAVSCQGYSWPPSRSSPGAASPATLTVHFELSG